MYLKWWSERTNGKLASLLLLLYLLQVIGLRLYYNRGITLFTIQNLPAAFSTNATNISTSSNRQQSTNNEFAEVSPTEVLMPIAMMLVLGVIHTQIVGTKFSNSHSSASTSPICSSRKSNSVRSDNHSISQGTKLSESIYCGTQTDHSTTSLSSCASSTPPSSLERPRNKKTKKDKLRSIPKIKIQDEKSIHKIVLLPDEDQDSINASEEETFVQSSPLPQRRYSDSKSQRNKSTCDADISITQCRRRYSESYCEQDKTNEVKCLPLFNVGKRKLFKNRSNKSSKMRKFRFDNSRPQNRHSTLASKGYNYYSTNGSSYDSEGTISPITPIASLPVKFI